MSTYRVTDTPVLVPSAPGSRRVSDRVADGCLAVAAAGLGYSLAAYWGWDVSAIDRLLIVAGAVWLGLPAFRSASTLTPRSHSVLGLVLIASGAVLLPITWFLQTGLPGWRVLLLWCQWTAVSAAVLGTVLARSGWAGFRVLLFPVVFLAFALPVPSIIDAPLKLGLQGVTTTCSEVVLRAFGMPVTRPGGGFVLHLPGGDLGVEEACSGVRSVTALTAIAAFLAHRFGFGPVRGVLLVLAAVPVVVAVNVMRVVLSGLIQEQFGGQYIRDSWHEGLGLAMVLVGVAGVRALVGAFRSSRTVAPAPTCLPPVDPVPPSPTPRRWAAVAAGVLVVGCVTSVLFGAIGVASASVVGPPPDLTALPLRIDGWEGKELPVPAYISDQLYPNAAVHREYRNAIGRKAFVWVLYWSVPEQIRGYHHPDICLPNAGGIPTARAVVCLRPTAGGEIPATARVVNGGREELYVLYWTQEGRRVWQDEDERLAQLGMNTGVRGLVGFVARKFGTDRAAADTRRLVVLIGSEDPSAFGRMEAESFGRAIADDLYRLCPWAGPPNVAPAPTD